MLKFTAGIAVWLLGAIAVTAAEIPAGLEREFPRTDFSMRSIEWHEIRAGGPPRDGIPAIDAPRVVGIEEAAETLADAEPVVGLAIGGEARAYPLRVLI